VALDRLHEMLARAALREVRRRVTLSAGGWLELADVAHQAASDEMLGILARWSRSFPGEGRHYCRYSDVTLDCEEWTGCRTRLRLDPHAHAESAELVAAVRRAVDGALTTNQRRVFVAIVVDGVQLEALVARLGVSRNALYKVVFDARVGESERASAADAVSRTSDQCCPPGRRVCHGRFFGRPHVVGLVGRHRNRLSARPQVSCVGVAWSGAPSQGASEDRGSRADDQHAAGDSHTEVTSAALLVRPRPG
jgi:RNA polymerase sigma-70 factor, ECF subfamily